MMPRGASSRTRSAVIVVRTIWQKTCCSRTRRAISWAYCEPKSRITMRHVLSAQSVQNVPGVLAHISGMLASRGYNIDSLAVGETEDPKPVADDVRRHGRRQRVRAGAQATGKIVTVVKVEDVSSQDYVERDLMLIKVRRRRAASAARSASWPKSSAGGSSTSAADEVMVEISGQERKIESFIDLMRPFGIVELVRTGRIAMVRGNRGPSRGELLEFYEQQTVKKSGQATADVADTRR
jgi:acetolactate synthase-1/3 small subunit